MQRASSSGRNEVKECALRVLRGVNEGDRPVTVTGVCCVGTMLSADVMWRLECVRVVDQSPPH